MTAKAPELVIGLHDRSNDLIVSLAKIELAMAAADSAFIRVFEKLKLSRVLFTFNISAIAFPFS